MHIHDYEDEADYDSDPDYNYDNDRHGRRRNMNLIYWKRRLITLAVIVGLCTGGVLWLREWLMDDPYVPVVTVQQEAPIALRPFVLGPTTCFGKVSQRVKTSAVRENEIPLPIVPNIPIGSDRYYASVVVEAELCVDGVDEIGDHPTFSVATTADATTITINQASGAIYMNRPAINALPCTEEQWAAGDPCLSMTGGPSNMTKIIELLPFTDEGNNLAAMTLEAAQVYGSSPECLLKAMASMNGMTLRNLLLATFQYEAVRQGINPDSIKLILLDTSGRVTDTWDATRQTKSFEAAFARLESTLKEGQTVSHETECDITGFGIAAPSDSSVRVATPAPATTISGNPSAPVVVTSTIATPVYPTPNGAPPTTNGSIWTTNTNTDNTEGTGDDEGS